MQVHMLFIYSSDCKQHSKQFPIKKVPHIERGMIKNQNVIDCRCPLKSSPKILSCCIKHIPYISYCKWVIAVRYRYKKSKQNVFLYSLSVCIYIYKHVHMCVCVCSTQQVPGNCAKDKLEGLSLGQLPWQQNNEEEEKKGA